ncbi:alpha/beta hydrolase [Cellulophaga sp. Hel_I_12]|uniref:alpha/beta hydrolase n=1 Tax=Cellulophaga sp. Hel_I_12 TaxID=1249972 RepID=UPI000645FD1E|nr:alpha/beta fold hydrolase [Cellulophaga sp. Hel_I_12]
MQTKNLSLYHIIKPSALKNKPIPVLFMLHGYGSDENDLFSFASELPENLCVISIRAPYAMQPFGNAWYAINFDAEKGKWSDDEQAKISRDKIASFITEACEAYGLDPTNVTLLGFSQGTILSYAVALSYPEKVNAVIALSGYINEHILVEGYTSNDFRNLNFYCSHGSVDQVIPSAWAAKAPDFLNKLGIKNTYEEFPVGHGVAPQNFLALKKWLLHHVKM